MTYLDWISVIITQVAISFATYSVLAKFLLKAIETDIKLLKNNEDSNE